ncbi:MAG: nucleoside deaminase [Gammaproteobacteria bacterium]
MGDADTAPADAERFMRIALQSAERGMAAGGPPVGACLVSGSDVLASGHNAVISELDITAHAEIVVIREACRQSRSLSLSDASLYVTIEPCPMCLTACYYAGIKNIFFGASIEALDAVTSNELCTDHRQWLPEDSGLLVTGGMLSEASEALIAQWQSMVQGRRV